MKFILLFIVLILQSFSEFNKIEAKGSKIEFHLPQTEAEKALDGILWVYANWEYEKKDKALNALPMSYWIDEDVEFLKKKREEYDAKYKNYIKFNQEFIAKKLFSKLLYEKYIEREDKFYSDPKYMQLIGRQYEKYCGDWEMDHILCLRDYLTYDFVFAYKTISLTSESATIQVFYTYPEEINYNCYIGKYNHFIGTYKLIKEDGRWKLDGIKCGKSDKCSLNFNSN